VTTDLTLLELSDFNHPLLRMLSETAPGTFHHSITIGNLAEAAAKAIGANSILARVGGYYHDIGKMVKPEYFVENQVGAQNRHTRLKPRMSSLIIQSHVKEGVELGRKYGLPEMVLNFIPQHHGTTRIAFFYDKALRQSVRRASKDVINESDFRYPGPKPQTKEAGIVMLADSVEASTRSITDITPQKLEQGIDNMIRHRFVEGELDECELTLRDLTKIRGTFFKILMGSYHQRIKYPQQIVEQPAPPVSQQPSPPESQPLPVGAAISEAEHVRDESGKQDLSTASDSEESEANGGKVQPAQTTEHTIVPKQHLASGNS
jgi:putative nucleotidyltransferase with HDIG domain